MKHISKQYEASSALTIFTVIGPVTPAELAEAINEFYEGITSKNILWDLTRGDFSLISNTDIQDLVKIPKAQYLARKGGKSALVADKDLAYGLARIYKSRTAMDPLPFETKVFRTMEEAHQWLDFKE